MSELQQLRVECERRKGRRHLLQEQADSVKKEIRELKRDLHFSEQAQSILQQVAQLTQQELEYHISELVTLALSSVFADPYELKLKFVVRRNKTEADLVFFRDEEDMDPLSATGGGVVDVTSFALRVALWKISRRYRPTLILDEPFRYLSESYLPLAGRMLKELSQKLNLQIIMVSHSHELVEEADKIFKVSQKDGLSKCEPEPGEKEDIS